MRKFFLKFINQIAKALLGILGFTLAASQCLAQYMAIRPTGINGRLTGITDTISRFRIIINEEDTLYSSWNKDYQFNSQYFYLPDSSKIEVSEISNDNEQKYEPVTKIIAIKPEEINETSIELKKKD